MSTRVVVALSVTMLGVLLFSARWIVAAGTAVPRPQSRVAAAPSPAPSPTLPRSHFVQPPFADLTPAAETVAAAVLTPMASAAVVEVVAASNVNPLDEWLTVQPLPIPDWKTIQLAEKNPAPLATSYRPMIRDAALRRSLSPELVEAIARVESDFNPYEVSEKGALGLLQVMPETGARFGVTRERLFDPQSNLAAGTAYLAWLRDHYRGDLDLILAAYNAGEGAVDQHGGIPPYRETQQYVKRVRAAVRQLEAQARRIRS
ncbi:MAG TPA: lytic transglycosylase domain-containing protein [Thermoanaerobaculia bacterium]|nr:lytic transglycosylase domain-containing protein [Thermoanaerobaculia bacterium]